MAFWGVEVKPGKPFTLSPDKSFGRLRISQATLGIGTSNTKSYVQCNVGKKTPVMLCVLLPDKAECLHLESEFDEAEEVTFSVVGPRSVYLIGYFLGNARRGLAADDESESFGEDIGESDTEDRSDEDEYEEDSFIVDSDPEVYASSPSTSDEIVRKRKASPRKSSRKRLKKTYELSESDHDGAVSQQNHTSDPIPAQRVENEQGNQITISSLCGSARIGDEDSKRKKSDFSWNITDGPQSEDKKLKRKNKKYKNENEASNSPSRVKNDTYGKIKSNTRTLSGGLVVDELDAGEEDGKVASSGKKVTIRYTGKLKNGNKIFDSTAGKDPLKFRLGKGRVMDGLELGIEGMRVGGKRRLQIPPALGYGSEGSGLVPPNSWLIMDVEMIRVR